MAGQFVSTIWTLRITLAYGGKIQKSNSQVIFGRLLRVMRMTVLAYGLKDVQNEPHDMDASTVFDLVLSINLATLWPMLT